MHQSKAQLMTALTSTEAEPIAAVTAAKNFRCMRSMLLWELGLAMKEPTPTHKDNKSAIKMTNADKQTGQSGHINI